MYLTFIKPSNIPVQTNTNYSLNDVFAGVAYEDPQYDTHYDTFKETKTIITDRVPSTHNQEYFNSVLEELKALSERHEIDTINQEYDTFYIPKRTGGLREINAPKPPLMETLKQMQHIFQYKLKVLYHNTAYAYVPHRNIVDALKVHQKNNSRWFLKLDIKDFFPNCSEEFVTKSLHKIYPFSTFTEEDLSEFLWLCFRNDQLPQGTPMSPMLTNLIMIPIDYAIQNYVFENNLCYTRYADDIIISGYNKWDWNQTVLAINTIFRTLNTPFRIKDEKTRFGSSSGRNWNLGLMLNKDNKITVGYKNKKRYKAMLNNLMIAEASAHFWERDQLYHFQGITSYYTSIEPDYFKPLIKKYEEMYNITLREIYKREL